MPYYTYLFIDMLTLVFNSSKDFSDGLADHLRHDRPEERIQIIRIYNRRRFRFNFKLIVDNDEDKYIYIGCTSVGSSPTNITIEFIPSRFQEDRCDSVWRALEWAFQDNFHALMSSARVSRLDVSFDVKPLSLDGCHLRAENISRSERYCSPNGQRETINLGSRRSPLSFCIYDKGKQQRSLTNEIARIEARLKPNIELSRVMNINNPFRSLTIIRSASPSELENLKLHYRLFWEVIENRGYQSAVGLLERPERRAKYRQQIESILYPEWYSPDDIWRSFPGAIRSLSCAEFGIHILRRRRSSAYS